MEKELVKLPATCFRACRFEWELAMAPRHQVVFGSVMLWPAN